MFQWVAAVFFMAILAAFLGFGGQAASGAGLTKVLCGTFFALAVLSRLFDRQASL